MKLLRGLAVSLAVIIATSCASMFRQDALIRGTIVGVGSGYLDVRHKSGRIVRITTNAAANAGIKPGVRTLITLEKSAGVPLVAREIRVFVTGKP